MADEPKSDAAHPAPKSWWGRNWKWFVPAGCLTMLVLAVGFVALIFTFVFGLMKSSDVYKEALARATASSAVIEALGTPIEPGFFAGGNIETSGPSGSANLSIPIAGPKGKGTIYLEARKSAGKWEFSLLTVEIAQTGQRIDLLGGGAPAPSRSTVFLLQLQAGNPFSLSGAIVSPEEGVSGRST
jgi:hypothetical protein